MESRIDTIELDRPKGVEEPRHAPVAPLNFVPERIDTIEPVRQPVIKLDEPVRVGEAAQPQPILQPTYLE